MGTVRFVHAADLHLDAPFQGIDASDPRLRESLVASTYEALGRIVTLCIEERVDFLVIAGDVYNSRDKSLRAQIGFQAACVRLAEAGIPVFVASGNHDPADGWSAGLRLPETVHHFSTHEVEGVAFERDREALCTLYGRGYEHATEKRDLAKGFHRSSGDAIAIGVLHTNVGGRTDYEDYAPSSMDELRAAGMDYWALGHVHKQEALSDAIRYCGCPQGLTPNEDGVRGCLLVEVGGGTVSAEFRPTCSVMWLRREIDVSGCSDIEDVRDALREACDHMRGEAEGRPVVARLSIAGRSEAHAALVRGTSAADLLRDVRDEQFSCGQWVWIDRLDDRTSAPRDLGAYRLAQDFGGDLVRLADEIAADPERLDALVNDVTSPLEASVGALDLGADPAELLLAARDIALDRLEDGEGR